MVSLVGEDNEASASAAVSAAAAPAPALLNQKLLKFRSNN